MNFYTMLWIIHLVVIWDHAKAKAKIRGRIESITESNGMREKWRDRNESVVRNSVDRLCGTREGLGKYWENTGKIQLVLD